MKPGLLLIAPDSDGEQRTEALVFRDGTVMVLEDLGGHVLEGAHLQGDAQRFDKHVTAARELLQPVIA